MEFKVKLNWTNKQFRKLSYYIFMIAIIGFCFSYLIDLPVNRAPSEIKLLYYFELLPKWILYVSTGTVVTFILALLTHDIRINTNGILRFYSDSVTITTKKKYETILFDQLKKIIFIVLPIRLRPYRIEFKYYNNKVKRIIIKNESEFHQIIEKLTELSPNDLEIDFGHFES